MRGPLLRRLGGTPKREGDRIRYVVRGEGFRLAGTPTASRTGRPRPVAAITRAAEPPTARHRRERLPAGAFDLASCIALGLGAYALSDSWFATAITLLILVGVKLVVETVVALLAPGLTARVLGPRVMPDPALGLAAVMLAVGGLVALIAGSV